MKHAAFALLLLFLIASASASAQSRVSDYAVSQSVTLTLSVNGLDGTLDVLTDSRIAPELQAKMWGVGDWAFVLDESDPRYAQFQASEPKNARLRLTVRGHVSQFDLDRPLAKVSETHLLDHKTTLLVATDYSVGFGSYAGVTTKLLDIGDGQFRWFTATAVDSSEMEHIVLTDTLKSAWKLITHHGNQDILRVYCRPAKVQVAGREFVVSYVRYRWDGKQWMKFERLSDGFWESDQPFPPSAAFP